MSSRSPLTTDLDRNAGAGASKFLDTKLAVAAFGITAVIVYGSLFPFHFEVAALPGGPLNLLLSTWPLPGGRSDDVSNFLLYLPFGLFFVRTLRMLPRWALVPLIAFAGFALSMCMEMLQFYIPGRDSSMADVCADTAGALAGALAAACLPRTLASGARATVLRQEIVWRPFAILLIACWLGNRLFPYFPAGDFHAHWRSLQTLATAPGSLDLYEQTVYWLAAGVILESILSVPLESTRSVERSRIALAVMIAAVAIARLFLIAGSVTPAEIDGAVIAIFMWAAMSRLRGRAAVASILFMVLVILQALNPFHFLAAPRPFGWIPFASLIDGPRDNSVRVFFEKAFTYGALVWLPVRAGVSLPIATIAGAGLVFCLRQAQVFLPGHSAEITDAVMVLMMAGLIVLLREPRP